MPTQFDALSQLIEGIRADLRDFRQEMAHRMDDAERKHERRFIVLEGRVDTIERARVADSATAEALAGQRAERSAISLTRRQWLIFLVPLGLAALGGPAAVLQAVFTVGRMLVGGQP